MNPAVPPLIERCPRLVRVPGAAVYVAPELAINCFYADGCYWVLPDDGTWLRSTGFDGPWLRIAPDDVPHRLLRLPLAAYRCPPPWLQGGPPYRPPRWDLVWGPVWAARHPDWDLRAPGPPRQPVPRPASQQSSELQRPAPHLPPAPPPPAHLEVPS